MTKSTLPVRRIMIDSLRLYFAPLTGAWRGIRAELDRVDRDIERRRKLEQQGKQDCVRPA